jgi:hypothetical protein
MADRHNQILDISLRCLMAHLHPEWGDRDALDVLNRLLAKNVRPTNWTSNTHLTFQRQQIRSRREQWTMHALAKLKCGHADPRGNDFDCPIVLAEYQGETRVLDGNHRINRWVANGDTRMHDVHIHAVEGHGAFVDLPAVRAGA